MITVEPIKINSHSSKQEVFVRQVLEEVISQGVSEFCICPGSRNASLVYALASCPQLRLYSWPEERSAAFFALGRIKAAKSPAAVVTTSGTAAAELLPACIEAYYTGLPLVLITADRPRRYRGTGAPQSIEQVGIYSHYTHLAQDLSEGEYCQLDEWNRKGPIHLNICLEQPVDKECKAIRMDEQISLKPFQPSIKPSSYQPYLNFIRHARFPLVVVGALDESCHENLIHFLRTLKAPLYLESSSGIRESTLLEPLRISCIENIWQAASESDYPIDGVLRIGGIPTPRFWRDIEKRETPFRVCSITECPFSGIVDSDLIHTPLAPFLKWVQSVELPNWTFPSRWKDKDRTTRQALSALYKAEPFAEASLIHELSSKIPLHSKIFLGNSLPIREWNQSAVSESRGYEIFSSRGANGIDGQIATFLGCCSKEQDNWAMIGDLTAIYDLAAPWIAAQLEGIDATLVIVNNGGAGIFVPLFSHPVFQNQHQLNFQAIAQFWKWEYEKWEYIPQTVDRSQKFRLIELEPDERATQRFLKSFREIIE